jgi:hypothetical protein
MLRHAEYAAVAVLIQKIKVPSRGAPGPLLAQVVNPHTIRSV